MSLEIARIPLQYGSESFSYTQATDHVETQAQLRIITNTNLTVVVSFISLESKDTCGIASEFFVLNELTHSYNSWLHAKFAVVRLKF